jgi:hypothetical protein
MKASLIFVLLIILGSISMGASTYGLGKNQSNELSAGYRASEVFAITGTFLVIIGLGGLSFSALNPSCPACVAPVIQPRTVSPEIVHELQDALAHSA